MPSIPTFTSSEQIAGAVPRPVLQNPAAIGAAGQALSEGLGRVEGFFLDVLKAQREQQQVDTVDKERTASIKSLSGAWVNAERNTDPATIQSNWQAAVQSREDEINRTVADPAVRRTAQRDLSELAAQDYRRVLTMSVKRSNEASLALLGNSLDTYAERAVNAPDQAARQLAMNAADQAIKARVEAGVLAADDGQKMFQSFAGRMDQASVLGLLNRNPTAALAALADPKQFRNLDEVARQRLVQSATTAMGAQASRAEASERRAERLSRLNADRAANTLYGQIAQAENGQGQMPTVGDVMAQRDWLSPGETSALLNRIRGASAPRDNPETVADLQVRIDREDPDQFAARAGRELGAGRLTSDTYRTMVNQNRNARRDDAPASAYRSGRSFVNDSLDPGNVVGGNFMRGPLAAARQNALADFDRWSEANPQATRDEAVQQARDLVSRYQVGADAQTRISLPRPFGFSGDRNAVSEADLQAAARRVLEAQRLGRLAPAQVQAETDALEAWRAILSRQSAPRAATTTTTPSGRGSARQPSGVTQ
ncbi:hypothetical protein IAI18_05265 [Acetobacteraceae bacterium H6797]|nr:hypothetical protein [Acetobacteraceae bacterium H6797]